MGFLAYDTFRHWGGAKPSAGMRGIVAYEHVKNWQKAYGHRPALSAARAIAHGVSGLGDYQPNVRMVEIPDGLEGTAATIGEMRNAAIEGAKDPKIMLLARKIVSNVPSRNYVGEAKAIYDWVRNNIKYRLDPHTPPLSMGDSDYIADYVQTPDETLRVRQGDCDDQSTLCATLLMASGHGAAFETVNADRRRPKRASHVYSLAGLRGPDGRAVYIPMDTTTPGKPFGWRPTPPLAWGHKDWVVMAAS